MAHVWDLPSVSVDQLGDVEERIVSAIDKRSIDDLHLLGFGELGVAVGWPNDAPTMVFKRQAPGPAERVEADRQRMLAYELELRTRGALVLPAHLRTLPHPAGRAVLWVVQPIIERERLAEQIIAADDPDPDHRILVSIRDTVNAVVSDTPDLGLSIDAQVTNFAWNDDSVVSLDTTPPLLWGSNSGPFYDIGNYLDGLPLLFMPAIRPKLRSTGDLYRTVRSTLRQTSVYFNRIDQARWVDASLDCFNQILDEPIGRQEVDEGYKRMVRDIPLIKNIARIERFWVERVKRRRYEFFITNSFTGEIL